MFTQSVWAPSKPLQHNHQQEQPHHHIHSKCMTPQKDLHCHVNATKISLAPRVTPTCMYMMEKRGKKRNKLIRWKHRDEGNMLEFNLCFEISLLIQPRCSIPMFSSGGVSVAATILSLLMRLHLASFSWSHHRNNTRHDFFTFEIWFLKLFQHFF